jgi:hypothetical protein
MAALPRHETLRGNADMFFLAAAGGSAVLVYSAILMRLPLLAIYTLRLKNLNQMPSGDWITGLLIIGCVVLLFASYAVGMNSIAAMRRPGRAGAAIVGFPILFIALLMLVFPITSTDIYDYLFRGRLLAHYGASPFTSTPQTFGADPFLPFVAWKEAVTAYGPLWEYLSGSLAWLLGETPGAPDAANTLLLRYLLGYKALAILGYLLCGGAIWGSLGDAAPRYRWIGLYLWMWNPLVLWETAAAGHNDAWMALCVAAAVWLFERGALSRARATGGLAASGALEQRSSMYPRSHAKPALSVVEGVREGFRKESIHSRCFAALRGSGFLSGALGLLALTAGGLIKFIAFFFGPVMLAATLRRLPNRRARWRFLVFGASVCATLIILAYAPFWSGGAALQNIGSRRTMFSGSWIAAVRPLLTRLVPPEWALTIASGGGMVLLVPGVVWASWRAWRAPEAVARHMLWLAMWFLFICNTWFQPWYAIWLVALAALMPWRGRAVLSVGMFCCTALMSYVVDGLILPALGLADASFGRESLLSAFIYLPALLVLIWGEPGLRSARTSDEAQSIDRAPPVAEVANEPG